MISSLMALEINMNRKKGTKAVEPDSLNPFVRKGDRKKVLLSPEESMEILKKVFCKGDAPYS